MNPRPPTLLTIALATFVCCCTKARVGLCDEPAAAENRIAEVDGIRETIAKNIVNLDTIAVIDHARLAAKAGVSMPPSIVTIYSDPAVNSRLMKIEPRLGLDLPCKILAYSEVGSQNPTAAFATSEFLARRHGIADSDALLAYQNAIDLGLTGIAADRYSPVNTRKVSKNFGVIELKSDLDFKDSIARLKKAVLSQGDTVWFGEIDYQKDAAKQGSEIPRATLLLFGGPAPGGKAMAEFPKLGLDAFCQKLLVYENEEGDVTVLFNDIVDFANLQYGKSNLPQKIINQRLQKTFSEAITGAD